MRKLRNFMSLLISFLVVVVTPVQAATNENVVYTNTDLLLTVLLISVTINIREKQTMLILQSLLFRPVYNGRFLEKNNEEKNSFYIRNAFSDVGVLRHDVG